MTDTTKTATVRRSWTGGSVCWAIDIDGFGDTMTTPCGNDAAVGVIAFDRKWVAEQFVEWFNAEMGDWDGRGCPEMAFKGSDAGEEYRWASWDGKAKLVG